MNVSSPKRGPTLSSCNRLLPPVVIPLPTEMSAQLSRISHTLGVIFPDRASQAEEPRVIELRVEDVPLACELHVKVCTQGSPCTSFSSLLMPLAGSRALCPLNRCCQPGFVVWSLLVNISLSDGIPDVM